MNKPTEERGKPSKGPSGTRPTWRGTIKMEQCALLAADLQNLWANIVVIMKTIENIGRVIQSGNHGAMHGKLHPPPLYGDGVSCSWWTCGGTGKLSTFDDPEQANQELATV